MLTTIALALPLLLASLPSVPPQDLGTLVRERAQAAAAAESLDDVWGGLDELSRAAGEDRVALDQAIDRLLTASADLPPRGVLLLTAARLRGDDADVTALAKRLEGLLADPEAEVVRGAASLLGNTSFRALKEVDLEAAVAALTAVAKDGDHAPETRVEAAVAMHTLGRSGAQRDARAQLVEFLDSSDPALRAMGALALARVGDVENGRRELETLAAAPTAEGRLAQSYLKMEEIRRFSDRRVKQMQKYAKDKSEESELKGTREARLLEQTMRLIETTSLEGEKVTREELINSALDGMLRSLDEHSSFLTPKAYKANFAEDLLEPVYGGIGAYVGQDPDDGLFTIRQPIYSGPAYKKGLHSDDKVVRIDDWPTFTSAGSRPLDDIIKRLKGKPGTSVKLYIWRRGMEPGLIDRPTEDMAVEITREEVTIPPMKFDMLPGGIGLLQLDTFSQVASDELEKAIEILKPKGLKAIILDLRQNTGGLLPQARDVANLFLPKRKLVVSTESRAGEPRKLYTSNDPAVPLDVPVVVLVSRYSASASEIVAGALQDHGRATVVGQRTYGKASVQELLPIPGERDDVYEDENKNGRHDPWETISKDFNGNGVFDFAPRARLTVARYRLPSGRSIHKERGEDGTILSEGGVDPEIKAEPRRLESSVVLEMKRVLDSKKIRDWLDKAWAKDQATMVRLAEADFDDPSRYPGFDALYAGLETKLSPQEVRMLLRREVRGRAQDARGAAYPDGDYEDDPMLQAAIDAALKGLNKTRADVPEFAATFDEATKPEDRAALAAHLTDTQRSDLRYALSLIGQAQTGSSELSRDRLSEIQRALEAVLDK